MNGNENSLVSVIMPVYNGDKYIAEAVQSVLEQTYQNFEIVIVDNYSTDNTETVVRSFTDSRIKYYKFSNAGIIAKARNYAIQQSVGEIIAFLDADDVWEHDKLAVQLPHLLNYNVAAVASNYVPIGGNPQCFQALNLILKTKEYLDFSYEAILIENFIVTSALITRKSFIVSVNGFDENRNLCFIEDWELWVRLAHVFGKIRILSYKSTKYRLGSDENRDRKTIALNTLRVIESWKHQDGVKPKVINQAMGNSYIYLGKVCMQKCQFIGVKYYWLGLLKAPGYINKLRAAIGIVLFFLPCTLRTKIMVKRHALLRKIGA
jgi:teichuronic acid biosynthesis glycosyltransferase TuaG